MEDHTKAFVRVKEENINLTEYNNFAMKSKTKVKTIASHNRIKAFLIKKLNRNHRKTFFFASRFLNPHEPKNSTQSLELLGVVWAIDH